MKRAAGFVVLTLLTFTLNAQKASVRIKAYQQFHVSGKAPEPETVQEIGGKEVKMVTAKKEPTYFIYLITNKVPYIRLDRIWINQSLYQGKIEKINMKPVISDNGFTKDTLVAYTNEAVWQVVITGKPKTSIKPKKDIEAIVAKNELVLRLYDNRGTLFTRSVQNIKVLESSRGQ